MNNESMFRPSGIVGRAKGRSPVPAHMSAGTRYALCPPYELNAGAFVGRAKGGHEYADETH
jgi:hypothetical protein